VYVRGVKVLSKDELFDGISINASLLKVNRDEIYNKLSRKKWVETVRITKIFPHTLVIDIEEKKPCIISEIKNKYYLLDKNGDIIDVYCPSLHIDLLNKCSKIQTVKYTRVYMSNAIIWKAGWGV